MAWNELHHDPTDQTTVRAAADTTTASVASRHPPYDRPVKEFYSRSLHILSPLLCPLPYVRFSLIPPRGGTLAEASSSAVAPLGSRVGKGLYGRRMYASPTADLRGSGGSLAVVAEAAEGGRRAAGGKHHDCRGKHS